MMELDSIFQGGTTSEFSIRMQQKNPSPAIKGGAIQMMIMLIIIF